MKCAFTFNGCHYIGPSKKEARKFLKFVGHRETPRRIITNWKIKHIERAPSYCQMMRISLDRVDFASHETRR